MLRQWGYVLGYYLALRALGACALPYCLLFFRRTPAAILVAASPVGLLLVSYLSWALGFAFGWPFTGAGVAAIAILLATAWLPLVRRGLGRLGRRLRGGWPAFWRTELVFLASLSAAVWVKMQLNWIYGLGEKFMDLSLFAHLTRLLSFPPSDPWLAGAHDTINYYYGGHLVFATLAKLTAFPLGVCYNLSIAVLFALTCAHAFLLGGLLCRRWRYGLLAALLVGVAGNLDPVWTALQRGALHRVDLLSTTRVIVDGGTLISEYPLFSFFWSDLHGHLSALPFGLLFVLVLWELARRPVRRIPSAAAIVVLAFGLGVLGFVNGMDAPGYALVTAAVLTVAGARPDGSSPAWKRWTAAAGVTALQLLAAGALVCVLFAPLLLRYHSPLQPGVPLGWTVWKTDLAELLRIWGMQLAVLAPFAVLCAAGVVRRRSRFGGALLVAALALAVWCRLRWQAGAAALLILLVGAVAAELTNGRLGPRGRFSSTLCLAGLLAVLACEFVFIRDYYGTPIQRRMTVFKLYFLAWTWLGLAVPYAVQRLVRSRALLPVKTAALVPFAALAACSLVAPYSVYRAATVPHPYAPTLDGQAYLARAHPAEYRAIRWLQDEIAGTPAILEAHGEPYGYYFRVSANTGLPTLIGSVEHERTVYGRSQRLAEIQRRIDDVRRIYEEEDPAAARSLLQRYGIDLVFVGELERTTYRVAMEKFESAAFTKLYDEAGVVIYRVNPPAGAPPVEPHGYRPESPVPGVVSNSRVDQQMSCRCRRAFRGRTAASSRPPEQRALCGAV